MRHARTAWCAVLLLPLAWHAHERAGASPPSTPDSAPPPPAAIAHFRADVQPLLEKYCYGCHGYGASEGGRTLDEFASDEAMLENVELWHAVLKNVRAGLMPPAGEDAPSDAERQQITAWIKADVFRTDPARPDPGRVTLRRLNRVEYRHTIRDLMGVDFNTTEEFPPDDTGYGFDTIGDVLSMSPLLLEKYIAAAETIVERGMPKVSLAPAVHEVWGSEFRSEDGKIRGDRLDFYEPARVAARFHADQAGDYRLHLEITVHGGFFFDPGRADVTFFVDGEPRFRQEYKWEENRSFSHPIEQRFAAGNHELVLEFRPLVEKQPVPDYEEEEKEDLKFHLRVVRIEGPLDEARWVPPRNHARFFPDGPPPAAGAERDAYARKSLERLASRAFRRPVDEATLDTLVAAAKSEYDRPGRTFEQGIGRAAVLILSSPKFLFRVEAAEPAAPEEKFPLLDEYALASRLSYFLWSTQPDDELWQLAERGELRASLPEQVDRMLRDERSQRFVENFVGQWLQARDIETVSINPLAVLGLDGEAKQLWQRLMELREQRHAREDAEAKQAEADRKSGKVDPNANRPGRREERSPEEQRIRDRLRELRKLDEKFDDGLWSAMRRETEMTFAHVMREDRSVLELLDADYTFLNERLAEHYGIPGVEGPHFRKVDLPKGSPRGGILTQGTMLVVTSNPTRTSPVKRGLFVLDNVLGTPAPPPPGPVPELEESAAKFEGRHPTLRELLEVHREDPLCHSCHARMDPLGLALENFTALGTWRDTDQGQPIDTAGQLITGEEFQNLGELKRVLVERHRLDFYRCLAEKMLTYALGRGMEYYDEHTIDTIVERLDAEGGRFSVLLDAVIESTPFQRRRAETAAVAVKPDQPQVRE